MLLITVMLINNESSLLQLQQRLSPDTLAEARLHLALIFHTCIHIRATQSLPGLKQCGSGVGLCFLAMERLAK